MKKRKRYTWKEERIVKKEREKIPTGKGDKTLQVKKWKTRKERRR